MAGISNECCFPINNINLGGIIFPVGCFSNLIPELPLAESICALFSKLVATNPVHLQIASQLSVAYQGGKVGFIQALKNVFAIWPLRAEGASIQEAVQKIQQVLRDNAFIDACAQKNLPLLLQIMESGPIDPEIFSMVLVELGKEGFIAMCQSLLTKQGVDIETFSILAQFNNH